MKVILILDSNDLNIFLKIQRLHSSKFLYLSIINLHFNEIYNTLIYILPFNIVKFCYHLSFELNFLQASNDI